MSIESGETAEGEFETHEEHFGEDGEIIRVPKTIKEISIDRFQWDEFAEELEVFMPQGLDISNMKLTDIFPIKVHTTLLFLKASNNFLKNEGLKSLESLQNLISLYLDYNLIKSTTLPRMEMLQQLNLEGNRITEIEPIDQPNLEILVLNKTNITVLQYVGYNSLPNLLTLSACQCQLKNMLADYALSMQNLYLSYNKIRRIEGLENLIHLKVLHLRGNKISKLGGLNVGLVRLEYLNLRDNEVTNTNELKIIKTLPSLRVIILTDNPVNDEMGSDIRPMILVYSLGLKRINKDLTDDEEVDYAKSLSVEVDEEEDNLSLTPEGSSIEAEYYE